MPELETIEETYEEVETTTAVDEDLAGAEAGVNESVNGHKEFDINDPALLEEEADEIDPDIDADDIPPPPPDAVYTVNWDFSETDADQYFHIGQYQPKGKDKKASFIKTNLIGTIVGCDKDDVPERAWRNRKLRTTLTSIPFGETSSLTDWLKSVGRKDAVQEAARLANKPGGKPKQFKIYSEAVLAAMVAGAQGKVTTQWKASYKRTDIDNKDEYVRPNGKLNDGTKIDSKHPINRYKRESDFPMKDKELADGTVIKVRDPEVSFKDPDTGESVTARANAEIGKFVPAR